MTAASVSLVAYDRIKQTGALSLPWAGWPL